MHQSLAQKPIQFCLRVPQVQNPALWPVRKPAHLLAHLRRRSRVKYSDFFQSAIHAISWNAECAESRRQLDDFSSPQFVENFQLFKDLGTIRIDLPSCFDSHPRNATYSLFFCPRQIFKRKWCHCHIVSQFVLIETKNLNNLRLFNVGLRYHLWNTWIKKTMETVDEKKGEKVQESDIAHAIYPHLVLL